MIAISIDDGDAERPKVVKWAKDLKPGFPVLHDPKSAAAKAFGLGDAGIPYNVVVDRTGRVIGTTADVEELTQLVDRALGPTPRRRAGR